MPISGRVEKGMRKGTKSCVECRKRKVKCIFEDDNEKCLTCVARGTKCMTQTKTAGQIPVSTSAPVASKNVSLEERVAQLEALLISQASGASSHSTPQQSSASHEIPKSYNGLEIRQGETDGHLHIPDLKSSTDQDYLDPTDDSIALQPVESLFNNSIWKQKFRGGGQPETSSAERDESRKKYGKLASQNDAKVCDELCRNLPSPRIIAAVISATCSWWDTWRAVGSWFNDDLAQNRLSTLQEAINWSLGSSEPAVAALGLLLFSICIQQLDTERDEAIIKQLPGSPGKVFQDYFDRVNRLVINNNGYSCTEPGVELIMLAAKTYMNLGLLKNVWILHHRAVAHAQLLGFHRPQRTSTETNSHLDSRREAWFTICERDLYTSLLLGLPYAANWRTISPGLKSEPGSLKFFRYQMIRLSARISDRNAMGLENSIVDARMIECDMDTSASQMSVDFWDAPAALQIGKIDEQTCMSHLAVQFWFFQAKVLLQQPLMIQSIEDHQLLYHRDACLAACRDTLRTYHLMRSDSMPGFSMVKVIDYQAFMCSAILLLGVLGYGNNQQPISTPVPVNGDDHEIVELTIGILRNVSLISNNPMASQAVQGLDTLAMLARYSMNRERGALCTAPTKNSIPYLKVAVPGSGIITICPGKLMARNEPSGPDSAAELPLPTFYLSHPSSQAQAFQRVPDSETQHDPTSNQDFIDIPTMDMDWTAMFGAELLHDDWAWLADVNASATL